jgi:hypothetical protein
VTLRHADEGESVIDPEAESDPGPEPDPES